MNEKSIVSRIFGSEKHAQPQGYLPNVNLWTHENKKVRFYDDLVRDRVVMINFMYSTCQGICPGNTTNLLRVQKLLGDRVGTDIFMYSISLRPEVDTPEKLKEYARSRGFRRGWSLLTGDIDDIDLIRRRLGFYDRNPEIDRDKSQHTGMVRIGNDALRLWTMSAAMAKPENIVRKLSWVAPAGTVIPTKSEAGS
jgi:protein SCO1/2